MPYTRTGAVQALSKRGKVTRHQFCSRLVAQAFREAGVHLVPDADRCTPAELLKSPLLVEIQDVLKKVSSEEEADRASHAVVELTTLTKPADQIVRAVMKQVGAQRLGPEIRYPAPLSRRSPCSLSLQGVRREKAALSSGCKPRPATAPAGSNRSRHGGDEMSEAFG
jgi:hypothetical protein